MILPKKSKLLLQAIPIEGDFKQKPKHPILLLVINATLQFSDRVDDLQDQRIWTKFRRFMGQKADSLNLASSYTSFYFEPETLPTLLSALTPLNQMMSKVTNDFLKHKNFQDLALRYKDSENSSQADVAKLFAEGFVAFIEEYDFDEYFLSIELDKLKYKVDNDFMSLPFGDQKAVILDAKVMFVFFVTTFYNYVSVIAYRESMYSLIKKLSIGGKEADSAICKLVRVDANLRKHEHFHSRYLLACENGDEKFLKEYNKITSPVTKKITHHGCYFMLYLLDVFGLLELLSGTQLSNLAFHAGLSQSKDQMLHEGNIKEIERQFLNRHKE